MREWIKKGLFHISDYFDDNTMFMAVRRGMVMMIPLLVSGALALMLISFRFQCIRSFSPVSGMGGW